MSFRRIHGERGPLRRILPALGSIAVVILCLVIVYRLWANHERNSLLAAIDRYRQAGEPVLPEDFAPPAHDDPDNPVPQWRAAAAALKPLDPELARQADLRILAVPITAADYGFLQQVLAPNQQALDLAKRASRMKGRADWQVRFTVPAITSNYPDLVPQRRLANMLKRAALAAHFRGNDAEASERTFEVIAQSQALQAHPAMLAHLISVGMEGMACDLACTIGPDLTIGSLSAGPGHPASREQVRRLIAVLLDERPLHDGQLLAYRSERMAQVQFLMLMSMGRFQTASDGASPGPVARLLCPQYYADARIVLDWTTGAMKSAQSPNYATARRRMDSLPHVQSIRGVSDLMISMMTPEFDRAITQDFRILTDDRLTALLLACRLYAVDHGGAFPARLEDLVPAYIPAVPADPFTTGSPLRYRGGADPIVYSVSDNGIDDGGSEKPINPNHGDDRWEELDAVTHLKLQPRPAPPDPDDDPPATQPAKAG